MKLFICIFALVAAAKCDETSIEKILHRSNEQFTTRMFNEVVQSNPGESVVLSAFSVLSPLAQLGLAAVGVTHDEVLRTIGFSDDNVTKAVFSDVNKRLRSVSGIELKLANRVYVQSGSQLNDEFAVISRDTFGSDVKNVDFTKQQQTADEINAWVEDNTNHRIKDLVKPDSLTANTAAVLVNAIYFKGIWKYPFQKQLTTEKDFHVTKDKTIKVPMMFQSQDFKYANSEELNAKLLEMPYEGEESSLLVILPNQVDGIEALKEKLKDPSLLTKAVAQMHVVEVDVSLPKFKIETTTNLKDVLIKMGCQKIFTPGEARLDNLIKDASDLYVSEAIQKAFIEVNEEGAEAAAANASHGFFPLPAPKFSHMFNANRSFYYELKIKDSVYFAGVYRG